jgi:hypothetical protein
MDTIPAYIQPDDPSDRARWREQGLRLRLLNGSYGDDLREEVENTFSSELSADLEINVDKSRNAFLMVYSQLNVAYSETPEVRVKEDAEADLSAIIGPELWGQQVTAGLYVLAINETLVRLDFKHWAGDTRVSYRVVPPSIVICKPLPDRPSVPGYVEELRIRDGFYTFETWDVRDPAAPVFKIEQVDSNGDRIDVTARYAPQLAADGAYPYRDTNGAPILPYVLYHKQIDSSRLWHYMSGSELSAGALRLGALWTHWGDGFISAAHPQRYALDVSSAAGVTRTISGVPLEVVPTDRKSILKFKSDSPSGGSLGSFSAAFSPLEAAAALTQWEQNLAIYAGLSPSDLNVTKAAASGYSIVVSRAGLRRQQKLIEPSLRIGDTQLLATAARLANFYTGSNLPEDPSAYAIRYRSLRPSLEERKAEADALKAEVDLGIASRIDVLRKLHPEIASEEEALERLLRVREIEKELSALEAMDAPQNAEEAPQAIEQQQPEQQPEQQPILEEAEKVKLTALNGAQVTSAQEIVQAVADRMLPRESGISMLSAFFNLPEDVADRIMGSVGRTFFSPEPDNPKEG